MSYCDAYLGKAAGLGAEAELLNRIADFVETKAAGVPGRLDEVLRTVQTRVRSLDLRHALVGVLEQWRARLARGEQLGDRDWRELVAAIHAHGSEDSIENYTAFFFSMDGLVTLEDRRR